MGIMQRAAETYEYHAKYVGEFREGHEVFAPIAHIITSVQIEIMLNEEGECVDARLIDKKEPKIIIPVTEDSAGRTSSPCPHPLCDQLSYLAPYDKKKHQMYLDQLLKWLESEYTHPKLGPIYQYIKNGTILHDLSERGIIKLTEKGIPEKEKQMVCWSVIGEEEGESRACWRDKSLIQNYISYYRESRKNVEKSLCMVTGEMTVLAKQHPKGTVPLYGNAKLISANDQRGFTYRGRMTEDWQAATVGYEVSQKAHNALRWILSEEGMIYGGRIFVCWNPQGKKVKSSVSAFLTEQSEPARELEDYKKRLKNTLLSFEKENQLTGKEPVVIAAFDAATTGRLAMTYYNELSAEDFLERLRDWDAECCWINGKFGIQSPSLPQIVNCAYGTQRELNGKSRMVVDERVMKQQIQKLLACRINGGKIPVDMVKNLVQKASHPQSYERSVWNQIIFVTCAVLRKHQCDRYKEEWTMALDEKNENRSYLFGRLLAIAEKVEEDTYRNGRGASAPEGEKSEARLTNALRMQTVFSKRPMYAWRILEEKLEPYYRRLQPVTVQRYKKLIGEIAEHLDEKDRELNQPLEDIYLLGYYHQRQELFSFRKKTAETDEQSSDK